MIATAIHFPKLARACCAPREPVLVVFRHLESELSLRGQIQITICPSQEFQEQHMWLIFDADLGHHDEDPQQKGCLFYYTLVPVLHTERRLSPECSHHVDLSLSFRKQSVRFVNRTIFYYLLVPNEIFETVVLACAGASNLIKEPREGFEKCQQTVLSANPTDCMRKRRGRCS